MDNNELPQVATSSPESNSVVTERESEVDVQVVASTEATSSAPLTSPEDVSSTDIAPQTQVEPKVNLPVSHAYYFIQIFDADSQLLRTVGSFFSKLDANVKASIRRHLNRPIRQDFLMWKRVDGATVTNVSPADSFDDVVAPHGVCFIIGDKLTKDK